MSPKSNDIELIQTTGEMEATQAVDPNDPSEKLLQEFRKQKRPPRMGAIGPLNIIGKEFYPKWEFGYPATYDNGVGGTDDSELQRFLHSGWRIAKGNEFPKIQTGRGSHASEARQPGSPLTVDGRRGARHYLVCRPKEWGDAEREEERQQRESMTLSVVNNVDPGGTGYFPKSMRGPVNIPSG